MSERLTLIGHVFAVLTAAVAGGGYLLDSVGGLSEGVALALLVTGSVFSITGLVFYISGFVAKRFEVRGDVSSTEAGDR